MASIVHRASQGFKIDFDSGQCVGIDQFPARRCNSLRCTGARCVLECRATDQAQSSGYFEYPHQWSYMGASFSGLCHLHWPLSPDWLGVRP
jgi:hypothetical protein